MRNFLLFTLLFLSFASTAQKIRFSDKRNQWVYWCSGNPDAAGHCNYLKAVRYGTDTIMFGRTYQSLVDSTYPGADWASPECIAFPHCWCVYHDKYIREDTTAGLVYGRFTNGSDTSERLLFNYNLHNGDTILAPNCIGLTSYTDSIIFFDSFLIGGIFHRAFFIDNIDSPKHWRNHTLIEGIGTYENINLAGCGYLFEYSERLLCFSQNGSYPVFTSPVLPIYMGFPDTFKNANSCIALGVSDPILFEVNVSISPNPATAEVTFKAGSIIQEIVIINLTGQVIKKLQINDKTVTTSIGDFPNGLYFAKIRYGEGADKFYYSRIVKD